MMNPNRPSPVRFLSILALLSLTACGTTGFSRSPTTDPAELEALKKQVMELRQRATVCEVDSDRAKQQVSELRSELAASRSELQAISSRAVSVEDVSLAETNGPFPKNGQQVEVEELEEEAPPALPVTAPEVRTQEAQLNNPPQRSSAPQSNPATSAPTQPSPEAIAIYDEGYTLFHQKEYGEAQKRFVDFIQKYPSTELTDNAQFWVGESLYAQGTFSSALSAFIATVDNYPSGNKVPDALFKAGKCLEALGQMDQARQTYQEVQDRFPRSAAAAGARERLAADL